MHSRYERCRAPVSGVLLILAAVACGADTPSGEHVDTLPRLVAERQTRIGDFDDPDLGFARIDGIDVDRDGNVFVLEGTVPEIRVHAPDGTFLRRIGGRGGGPGEFEFSPRFGVVGDTLWAVDPRNQRITLFDRGGRLLSTGIAQRVAIPLPRGFGYVVPLAMRADGRFTSHFGLVAARGDDPATGVQSTDRIPFPFVLFNATGAVTDTIGWAHRPPPRMWRPPSQEDPQPAWVEVGGGRRMAPSPPSMLPWWLALPDGYVLVETRLPNDEDGLLTVTRIGLTGDTIFQRALNYRASRYSDAELDTIAARAARGEVGGMVPVVMGRAMAVPQDWPAIANALRRAMQFPEFKLPVETAWLAQDESVWLRLRESEGPTRRWVVFDGAGQAKGLLELPADARVLWSRGDSLIAAEPDEHGVPWVVSYAIRSN